MVVLIQIQKYHNLTYYFCPIFLYYFLNNFKYYYFIYLKNNLLINVGIDWKSNGGGGEENMFKFPVGIKVGLEGVGINVPDCDGIKKIPDGSFITC